MASNETNPSMCTVKLQLADIVQYVAGGSRLIVEGERVFQANHLLLVGVQTIHEDGVSIFATCLKSSSPRTDPHKISIRTKPVFEKWSMQCSCKAGMGKCKHVMAVLNHLLMFSSIPLLTATDVQQKWGKIAEKVAEDMYKATLLTSFCMKPAKSEDSAGVVPATSPAAAPVDLTPEERVNILHLFVEGFPESSLAYETNGRPEMRDIEKSDETGILNELLGLDVQNHNLSTISMDSLISVEEDPTFSLLKSFLRRSFHPDNFTTIDSETMEFIGPLEKNLHVYLEVNVNVSEHESMEICTETTEQSGSSKWKDERSRRITASRAYSLYTYYTAQPEKVKDWKKKILSMVMPKQFSTPAMEHGLRCEIKAVAAYERDFRKNVLRCGFVVPPHMPWLGCSPDGIVIDEDKVIEIKCPEAGKNKPLSDFIDNLPYFTKHKFLKKNHQYYAQVQLNMFILKCKSADFIVYSEHEDRCYVQEIQFDFEYVRSLVVVLKEVYFNVFLKYLYSATFKG